jgi:uncharacterized iron-regulated membrane protein
MVETTLSGGGDAARASATKDVYRAVWRWHFYAGLMVLPFLITLAITGGLFLFHDEIDSLVHSDLMYVEAADGQETVAPSAMVAAAVAAYPGTAVKYTDPLAPDASAVVTVSADSGERLAVYVDPYTGKVLGSLSERGTIMWTVRYLHSLNYFGPVAAGIIEIVGGCAILLVGTGIYLWWPRSQGGGVLSVRGSPKRRVFWRDMHAVTGLFVGFFILFLAVTGMPWSGVWGAKVNEWANGNNFGYPSGVYVDIPMSERKLTDIGPTSWSLEQAKIPESGGAGERVAPIGLDRAVGILDDMEVHAGFAVGIPGAPTGVYSASVYPDDMSQQRIVHLDQYSGEPLIDMSYADYGPLAKSLEWGISVHMGQEFGLANQLVLLAACIAIVLLAVSAAVMWWKRRPEGALGVPPLPSDRRVFRGLFAILIAGGAIFPLVGASLLAMLAFDWLITRAQRRQYA